MKIGVIADSHDHMDNLAHIVNFFNKNSFDYIFHCGDIVSPFAVTLLNKLEMPYFGVYGNNDGEIMGLSDFSGAKIVKGPVVKDINGFKFAIFHEPVLVEYIKEDVNYVLYGHTHSAGLRRNGSQIILNPGTLAGYMSDKASFAVIDTDKNSADIIEI